MQRTTANFAPKPFLLLPVKQQSSINLNTINKSTEIKRIVHNKTTCVQLNKTDMHVRILDIKLHLLKELKTTFSVIYRLRKFYLEADLQFDL